MGHVCTHLSQFPKQISQGQKQYTLRKKGLASCVLTVEEREAKKCDFQVYKTFQK